MKDEKMDRGREEGLRKYALIAPLLEEGVPAFEMARRRSLLREQQGISERTLRRWVAAYRKGGFEALVKAPRKDKGLCKALSPEVLALAEACRKELPRRSAGLIHDWLKHQGHTVARSTLERHLRQRGLSGRVLMAQGATPGAGRRFVRIGRNTLWQADMKYGPFIPSPGGGKKQRTYLMVLIDDATRLVVHAQFYDNQRQPILEDALKKAIQRNGSPRSIYVDNGKIFVSTWMKLACAHLNIRHLNTRPYNPEAKGKVERFNRTVEEFFKEAALCPPATLKDLNDLFRIWLSERYQHKPHSSLGDRSPAEAFAQDTAPLRFHSLEALQHAFLHEEERVVDKSGCLKLGGILYDAGVEFLRKKVQVRYDPFDLTRLQLWHGGNFIRHVVPVQIGEHNQTLKAPPERVEQGGACRVLKVYEETYRQRQTKHLGAFRLGAAARRVNPEGNVGDVERQRGTGTPEGDRHA